MLQGWHDLASVHWPVEPAAVRRLLPPELDVDVCTGLAWVGLIPFQMHRIRVPGLPSLGAWSSFPETNVRTYVVTPDGRRAVWFFSLDVSRLVPAVVARTTYGLPYCWSAMSISHRPRGDHDVVEYRTRRRWPRGGAASALGIEIGDAVDDDQLTEVERFVTARWALASTLAGTGLWAEIDHEPWPLHRGHLVSCDETLVTAAGLPEPVGEPVVLWSPGVEVRIGRPRRAIRSVASAGSVQPVRPAGRSL